MGSEAVGWGVLAHGPSSDLQPATWCPLPCGFLQWMPLPSCRLGRARLLPAGLSPAQHCYQRDPHLQIIPVNSYVVLHLRHTQRHPVEPLF